MAEASKDASEKWLAEDSGAHYSGARFANERARERDVRAVLALIDATHTSFPLARVLDVPCGSGRLSRALAARARRYVGADVSTAMLAAAQHALTEAGPQASSLIADGRKLPFPAGAFDLVVACRWLHHLHGEQTLQRAISELTRVSRGVVIASFWDECSLPGWRRSMGLKGSEGPTGRRALSRAEIARCFDLAGADVIGWRATLRFVSQQTFVAARVRAKYP